MLILLVPYKFTEYHYIHYELDIFEKKLKNKFEVHDLSNIINPKLKTIFKLKRHKKTKIFFTIKEWQNYFLKVNKKYKKVEILNLLDLTNFKSLFIHFIIQKYKKKIIQLKSPGLPNFYIEKKRKKNFFDIKKKIYLLRLNFLIFHFKTKLVNLLAKFIIFDEIYYLVRGDKINFNTNLNSKKNTFVTYHSHDFSRLSFNKKTNYKEKPIGVYLDSPGPYFKEDYSIFGLNFNYDKLKWYRDLNKFLSKVEKIYFCKIIIIPHPKVKRLKNPHYNEKFKVNHDLDAVHKLIPKSKVVVSIGASTAIGIAVACNKKILITYNDQIKKFNNSLFEVTKFIAGKCDANFINLNNYDNEELIKSINKKKYNNYFHSYVSSKNISKKKNYEIFNDLLEKI